MSRVRCRVLALGDTGLSGGAAFCVRITVAAAGEEHEEAAAAPAALQVSERALGFFCVTVNLQHTTIVTEDRVSIHTSMGGADRS